MKEIISTRKICQQTNKIRKNWESHWWERSSERNRKKTKILEKKNGLTPPINGQNVLKNEKINQKKLPATVVVDGIDSFNVLHEKRRGNIIEFQMKITQN